MIRINAVDRPWGSLFEGGQMRMTLIAGAKGPYVFWGVVFFVAAVQVCAYFGPHAVFA